jgi:hypothetical protein
MLLIFKFFYVDDPQNDPNVTGDPYKTLFVARLVSIFTVPFSRTIPWKQHSGYIT